MRLSSSGPAPRVRSAGQRGLWRWLSIKGGLLEQLIQYSLQSDRCCGVWVKVAIEAYNSFPSLLHCHDTMMSLSGFMGGWVMAVAPSHVAPPFSKVFLNFLETFPNRPKKV